jgi:hypothetical protein
MTTTLEHPPTAIADATTDQPVDPAPDPSPQPPDPQPDDTTPRLVPVTESIRYRKRAQSAERELEQAREQVAALRQQVDQSRETIDALERRQRVHELLADADAVDVEVAALLTEQAVAAMAEPDVKLAVDELRRAKPYLFRHRPPRRAETMAGRIPADAAHDDADHAAQHAAATGDRQDLLRYLRLRRK